MSRVRSAWMALNLRGRPGERQSVPRAEPPDMEKLERERVASMADEGGAAAAEVEAQPAIARPARRTLRPAAFGALSLVGALATVVVRALGRRRRDAGD